MSSEPGESRIRNQRYPRWSDMLGGMAIALILFGVVLMFVPARPSRLPALITLMGVLGLGLYILYGLFRLWDLRRPLPRRSVAARALFEWLVLGIRRKELGPADGWTALVVFRPPSGSCSAVYQLKLGDGIEVDNPFVVARFPARAVARVHFGPDPKEDYAGSEHPAPCCEATVETASGRRFGLTVTEADALRLRQWALAHGVAVSDGGGYVPRPSEPARES